MSITWIESKHHSYKIEKQFNSIFNEFVLDTYELEV